MFFKYKEKKVWRQLKSEMPGFSTKVNCGKKCFIKAEIRSNGEHLYSVHRLIEVNGKKFWSYVQETFNVVEKDGLKYFNPPKVRTGKYPFEFLK